MLLSHPGDHLVLLGDDAVLAGELLFKGLDLADELLRGRGGARLQRRDSVLEEALLLVVEHAGLKVVLFAELRHRDLLDVVPREKGGLLLGGE